MSPALTRQLAVLSLLLGVAALLEAVDSGIVVLPFPVGPVWIRLVLELVWIGWTFGTLARRVDQEPGSSRKVKWAALNAEPSAR